MGTLPLALFPQVNSALSGFAGGGVIRVKNGQTVIAFNDDDDVGEGDDVGDGARSAGPQQPETVRGVTVFAKRQPTVGEGAVSTGPRSAQDLDVVV